MVGISVLFFYQRKYDAAERKSTYRLTEEEKELLQEGDIIFRHGFGLISDAIVKYTKDIYPISHCGIIVKDSLGELFVIHTVSNALADVDGMQQDNLNKFVKESHLNSVMVSRYNYTDSIMPTKIAEQAKSYLSQQIPFDHRFDCDDSTAFFCTEFVWRVFNRTFSMDLYNLSPFENADCTGFSAFLHPDRFSIILNHCEE